MLKYKTFFTACFVFAGLSLTLFRGGGGARAATAPVNVPAEATLDLSKKPTLFLVGYSHLDTQWRWGYPQVIRQFLPDTFNNNFTLFEKFPHYTFNFTGAGRYKLIKDYYPAEFEKIRAAVAAGRWWPAGVAWEENDANVPSVESQIRQFLQGHEFFLREFGAEGNEFMLPDCFGFPAALPSVLAHCGIRGFSTQKLEWGSANGIPFNVGEWIGTDGNSIIAALNALAYDRTIKEDPSTDPAWIKRIRENGDKSGIFADFTYMGTGDVGGAPDADSDANMEHGAESSTNPVRVICARADLMFNSISDEQMRGLPKYTGDLLLTEHSAGSITSQAYMKRWNRANELLADAAERASVAAWLLGAAPYPREKLNGAWQIMLRSQFHDTLPGTCIPKAYEYAWNDEVLCMNTFAEVLTNAVGAVASGMKTGLGGSRHNLFSHPDRPPSTVALVVYNPLSIDRQDVVEATITMPHLRGRGVPEGITVNDDGGTDGQHVYFMPTQVLSRDGDTYRIAFLATIPSVGFQVFFASRGTPMNEKDIPSELSVTDRTLENARYRVTLNDAGDIASIFDKKLNRELLASPARLAFQTENPRNWPAWNMDWADRKNPPRTYVGADATSKARIEIVERGPVRVALRVTREAEGSTFEQTIRLSAGGAGNRVEISNTIDWRTKASSLKAEFPLTVANPLATYNEDLGKIQRGNNDPKKYEVPSHQWFDLTATDGACGVSILTAAKYGSDKPDDHTVRLTLLYTPGIARAKDYLEQRWQDWGRHDITYGIYAHDGDWRKGGTDWQALRMEQPLLAFTTPQHDGPLGLRFSLLKLDNDAVAVRAIKLAEDSNKVIVRLQELNGETQTNVNLTTQELTGTPRTNVNLMTPATVIPLVGDSEVNGVEKVLDKLPGDSLKYLPLHFNKYQLRSLALACGAGFTKGIPAPVILAPATSAPVTLPYNMNAFGWRGASDENGDFDGAGATFPAEMIADTVTSEGITFKLAPDVALAQSKIQNPKSKISTAVRCEGQTIALPHGDFNRVYLLAASVGGTTSVSSAAAPDATATFLVGDTATPLTIQNWTGYIGSWDNRVFEGEVPESAVDQRTQVNNALARIDAGYIKRDPVAWYSDHHYHKDGTDAIYEYCYLFKYALDIPAGAGAKTVKLPDNPRIRIFAMTAARDPAAGTQPARALYDDFTGRKPIMIPNGWANANAK